MIMIITCVCLTLTQTLSHYSDPSLPPTGPCMFAYRYQVQDKLCMRCSVVWCSVYCGILAYRPTCCQSFSSVSFNLLGPNASAWLKWVGTAPGPLPRPLPQWPHTLPVLENGDRGGQAPLVPNWTPLDPVKKKGFKGALFGPP